MREAPTLARMATVLFTPPHQDDDTLPDGVAIRDHLNAGHDVHVLLLTTGQNSGVRAELGMSIPDFIAARDDEMLRACRQIGVLTANIHIPTDRPQDGQLTQAQAETMITAFYDDHPGAWLKSYSDLSALDPTTHEELRHVDHITSGKAARALLASGLVTNLRFYVEPWLLTPFRATNPHVTIGTETIADKSSVLRAYAEYARQDHVAKMYGIGHLSVGAEFDANTPPFSYYHVP